VSGSDFASASPTRWRSWLFTQHPRREPVTAETLAAIFDLEVALGGQRFSDVPVVWSAGTGVLLDDTQDPPLGKLGEMRDLPRSEQ
jgi:hypothetical protein